MAGRGAMTPFIQQLAEKHGLGHITTLELRLMPYLQYCLMNERRLDPNKISHDERNVISKWRQQGFIDGGSSKDSLRCNILFWRAMSEILFEAYVDYDSDSSSLPTSRIGT